MEHVRGERLQLIAVRRPGAVVLDRVPAGVRMVSRSSSFGLMKLCTRRSPLVPTMRRVNEWSGAAIVLALQAGRAAGKAELDIAPFVDARSAFVRRARE